MTTMNSQSIENQICDAVQILAERAIDQANYDKTISALIVECVDTLKGKYKVKYQDAFYYATSDNTELTYRKNTEVYILIPGNDFSKEKKILGTVKDMEEDYKASLAEIENMYEQMGTNCLPIAETGLCSYHSEIKEIFNASDIQAYTGYESFKSNLLQYGTRLRLTANVKTNLPPEQRNHGNYGIIVEINFYDDATKAVTPRTLILDIDNMIGMPYNFGGYTKQYIDFDVEGRLFESVSSVKVFVQDFPNTTTASKPDDIWIRDIQLICLGEGKNTSYLKIDSDKGTVIGENNPNTTFTAIPMMGSKEIVGADLEFYWFAEDASITPSSSDYCSYGGKGWKCLNEKDADGNWIVSNRKYTITTDTQLAQQLNYQCVCKYGDYSFKGEFLVDNADALYTITINSSNGTDFINDRGKTDLECKITGVDEDRIDELEFYWCKVDNSNVIASLDEANGGAPQMISSFTNKAANEQLQKLKAHFDTGLDKTIIRSKIYTNKGYNTLLTGLGIIYEKKTNEEVYNSVVKYVNDNLLTYIEKGTLFNLLAKSITISNIYKCTVKLGEQVLGSASIKLTNLKLAKDGTYAIIKNGTQVFKYDENGRTPTHQNNVRPQVIKPLYLTLFDTKGNEISDEVIQSEMDITWIMPQDKTMLKAAAASSNIREFAFDIASLYQPNYVNNDIEVKIIYKGELIQAQTDFTFIKDGSMGTNGSDYYCKIVPTTGFFDGYPTLTYYPSSRKHYLNTYPTRQLISNGTAPFKVQLWNSGEEISGVNSVKWRWLIKGSNAGYDMPFNIAESGVINNLNLQAFENKDNLKYLGILQAEVSYDKKKYFAELPIVYVRLKDENHIIEIKEGTGFNEVVYASDGTNPRYSSSQNFAISAIKIESDGDVDLVQLKEDPDNKYQTPLSYTWSTSREDTLTLKASNDTLKATPVKEYNGEVCDIGIQCVVKNKNNAKIADVYFPIHFMLNKYGFSALNDWDGNGIKINEEEKYILSPQIGAGKKDSNNRFTGVLMGAMKESGGNEDVGLLGFHEGERTIFLDANTGKAEFGKAGAGQIILDPTSNTAKIQSGNYSTINKTGMLIDFTTPEIKFGSGKFSVNSAGEIHATGAVIDGTLTAGAGSKIGPWVVSKTAIYKEGGYNSSTIGSAYFGSDGLSVLNKFRVDSNGVLNASGAIINGTITAGSGSKIGGWTITDTTIQSGNIIFNSSDNTIKAGSNFSVSNTGILNASGATISGTLTAGSGSKIGGWEITGTRILGISTWGGKTYYNSFNVCGTYPDDWTYAISIGEPERNSSDGGKFKVHQNGTMYTNSGIFYNCKINGTLTIDNNSGNGLEMGKTGIYDVDVVGADMGNGIRITTNRTTLKGDTAYIKGNSCTYIGQSAPSTGAAATNGSIYLHPGSGDINVYSAYDGKWRTCMGQTITLPGKSGKQHVLVFRKGFLVDYYEKSAT